MKRKKQLSKYRLPLWLTLSAAVLLSGAITLLALWCQPNAFRSVLIIFRAQPLLIVLNSLPVGLLVLAFTCLLRNVFFGAALTNLIVCGLSVVNRVKIEVRDEPLFPRDFGLLKEVGAIVNDYAISYPWGAILVVVLATLALAAVGTAVRCKPFPAKKLRGWVGGLLGATASLAVLTGAIFTVYASNDLYNSFRVSNAYYIPSVFNELGFPYCFCHQFTTFAVDRPEGFDRDTAEAWDTGGQKGLGKDVHVIMVMDEAFSDLSDGAAFSYDAANDPLANLHALQQETHSISGHMVVPNFAAGTANTEFDVLTGMQTNALSATTTSALRVVNRNLDSLFRVFAQDGYRTSFFHPGDDWFYNRENVFRWFGAEKTLFIDEMTAPEMKGRWVTDEYLAGLIEAEFEEAVASGETLFHYTTTIQNHMSYTLDKYDGDYTFPEAQTTLTLSPETETLVKVYIEGARDGDAMLGRLWNYFSARQEPVVLCFFGDHLPYLGDNQSGYQELGFTQQESWADLISYETPYLIWANDAAAEALNWEETVSSLALPEDNTLSAAFVGSMLLELTGRSGESPWFDFLNQLRRELPVVQKQLYVTRGGTVSRTLTPEQESLIAQWRQWSYYKLRYKDID